MTTVCLWPECKDRYCKVKCTERHIHVKRMVDNVQRILNILDAAMVLSITYQIARILEARGTVISGAEVAIEFDKLKKKVVTYGCD